VIVDFEQDPSAPFGSGNFRDEAGRITYLHDPETASDFVTTMSGSQAASRGGGGGAPEARLAMNDTGQPTPVGDLSAPAPPMPNTAPPTAADTAGTALTPAEVQSLGGTPETLVNAVAKAVPAPGATAAPSAPGAAPGVPQGGPQKLIDAVVKAVPPPRSQQPTQPAPAPTGGLPVSGINTTSSRSVVKGRPSAPVDSQIAEEERSGSVVDQMYLSTNRAKDAATDSMLAAQGKGIDARREREAAHIAAAEAAQQTAKEEKAKVEAALKKNDESLDPDSYMKHMSTGRHVSMTILAAINGAFGALIGQKGNGVVDVLNRSIDADIERQKQEIASGHIRMGNTIHELMQDGHDAKTAEMLARDRLDSAIDQKFELDAKRQGVAGENEQQAKLFVAGRQEARAAKRGDLLATKEDKIQEATNTVVQREAPKGAGPQTTEEILKLGQLHQQRLAAMDAGEVAKVIGSTEADGKTPRSVSNDRAKVIQEHATDLAVKMPRFEVAENRIRQGLTAMGVPLEAYDSKTGVIDWSKVGDLRGVGPIDSRPLLKEGPIGAISTELGFTRPESADVLDTLIGVQEDLTFATTGATATTLQSETFRKQSGQDLKSQDSVKANLTRTAQSLATQRNSMLAGDADATKLYRHNLNRNPTPSLSPGIN
jgi:hypothetical protein